MCDLSGNITVSPNAFMSGQEVYPHSKNCDLILLTDFLAFLLQTKPITKQT